MSKRLQQLLISNEDHISPVTLFSAVSETEMDLGFANLALESIEVEYAVEDHATLLSVAEGLESIGNFMVTADNHDSKLLSVALDSIVGSTGLSVQPSLESVTETIAKIWKAIKDAIKNAMIAVKKWWVMFTDHLPKIKTRAEDLYRTAKAMDDTPKSKDIVIPKGLLSKVTMGGKFNSVKECTENLTTFTARISKFGLIPLESFNNRLSELTSHREWSESGIEKYIEYMNGLNVDGYNKKFSDAPKSLGDIFDSILGKNLKGQLYPGEQVLIYDKRTFSIKMYPSADIHRLKIDDLKTSVMSKGEIMQSCESIIKAVVSLEKSHKEYVDGIGKYDKNIMMTAESLASELEADENLLKLNKLGQWIGQYKLATIRTIKSIGTVTVNGPAGTNAIYGYMANTLNKLITVTELSVKEYGVKVSNDPQLPIK